MLRGPLAAALVALAGAGLAPAPAAGQDFGGLPPGEGRTETFAFCTSCHSTQIIMQQGMSRKKWDETLTWMVEEQGMQPMPPDLRETVLDYLAAQFPPARPNYDQPSPYRSVQPLMAP
jgi:hypothetical protein